VRCALRLAPLVFVRSGDLRKAEWSEFDLDGAEWRIPGERMKARVLHIVPLSRQAVAILRDLHTTTGDNKYLFPSVRSTGRPMSDNTLNAALRRLGYTTDDMTAHGFRSMASTLLNEQGRLVHPAFGERTRNDTGRVSVMMGSETWTGAARS
jgi:integrase